jgi:hypothetical protein
MASKQPRGDKAQKEMEALVARALKEPGVAEALEVYEKAEAVYAAISAGAMRISESAANSTSGESLGWG